MVFFHLLHHNFISPISFTLLYKDAGRLPPSGETYKYAVAPITQTWRNSIPIYSVPFCRVCLCCWAAELGISAGTSELPCVLANI
jgi:hypothetical protein